MSDQPVIDPIYSELLSLYPQGVELETRAGYSGVIVSTEILVAVMMYLRDTKGFDYLSMVTAVDDFPEDQMEVVYVLYKTIGGSGIQLKTFTRRDEPEVPSLTSLFPG